MAVTAGALARREDRRQLLAMLGDGTRPYSLDEQSLTFDPDVSYEEWARATEELIELARSVPFWVADALAFGEEAAFSERAAQVLPDGGWAWQTMSNYAYTAKAVAPERRHPDLTFAHHQEVAALPPPQQSVMLDLAEEEGWSSIVLRDQVRKAKRKAARILADAQPVPELAGGLVRVELGDATRLPLSPGSVDVIITSPPYGLHKPYGGHQDEWHAWEAFIGAACTEAYRVATEGGRLALNVPLDTTVGGCRPTYAQAVQQAVAAGWTYRFTIDWAEGNVSKSVARGSVDSPSAPHVIARGEMIAVFSRGEWKRDAQGRTTDLEHEEWLAWTDGDWAFQGEAAPWEGFEAAFPTELPYRLIKLLSYREDVILDPFAGSGTTLVVAQRLGRRAIGYDNDPRQVASIKRRLAAGASLTLPGIRA